MAKNKSNVQVVYTEASHIRLATVWDYVIGIPLFVVEIVFFTWLFSGGRP